MSIKKQSNVPHAINSQDEIKQFFFKDRTQEYTKGDVKTNSATDYVRILNKNVRKQVYSESKDIKHAITTRASESSTHTNKTIDLIGSDSSLTGQNARVATSCNNDLAATISQFPDRNTEEPVFNPLPNFDQCLIKAEKVTAESKGSYFPTIKRPADIITWVGAWLYNLEQQLTANRVKQVAVATQMSLDELEIQIEQQEKYLKDKYGEELYNLYFKAQVEAGAVFTPSYNPCTITKKDLFTAGFTNGLTERRNAALAKM